MVTYRYPVAMEISGLTALWNRPDCGDTPCSYPAPTYSAVKAIFESILWGPAVTIVPQKVELCAPIHYHSYATNYNGPLRDPKNIRKGNGYQMFATVLVDVCYRLYAEVIPNADKSKLDAKALAWDQRTTAPGHAYQEMFNKRLRRGQSYSSICLGWHEFTPSYFGPFRDETQVCTDMPDIVIPSMLRQVFPHGYRSEYQAVYDTDVLIHQGVLVYPQREVR